MKQQNKECSCNEQVQKITFDEDSCIKLSNLFKVFSDFTRMKILSLLLKKELSVCEISSSLDISHSLTSHQLQYLRKNKLVKFRKEGKAVFYSLDDEHVKDIIDEGMVHINEQK